MRSSSSSITNRVKYQVAKAGDRSKQHNDGKDNKNQASPPPSN